MKLYYFKSPKGINNFGDDLNLWLWEKLVPGIFDDDPETIFIGLGTLLNDHLPPRSRTVVFGSGVGYGEAPKVDDSWRIYCVRGPLSAKALGIPETFAVTDGAALVRRLFSVNSRKKYRFSYMPHFTHTPKSGDSLKAICDDLGFGYIDPCLSIEDVLSAIGETECLIAESMHGAIVADSFRVPWIPVKTSPSILGFKWQDWCASVGVTYRPHSLMPIWDADVSSSMFASARRSVKMKFIGAELKRIAERSPRYLSDENLLERLTSELEERCRQMKQDLKAGMFAAKTTAFSNVPIRAENMKYKISVLIITKNRSFVLGECLSKIHLQIDASRHEVVVVDSSEDDQTKELAKQFPWVNYHRIQLPPGTRPQAYSHGVQVSRGEIIAFLDDDAYVHPGWLEALERCYDDPLVGAAGGRVLSTEPRSSVTEYHPGIQIGRVLPSGSILSNLHLDSGVRLEVDTVRGCNMSARKDLLEKIGYFDPRLKSPNMRVEDDVCIGIKRLGYKIIYEPKAAVLHLAAKRPDALRTVNLKNEFNSSRNTVWFYFKHFRFHPVLLFNVAFLEPISKGIRRIIGGSFRRPQFSLKNFRFLLPAAAGLLGAWWGVVASLYYGLQDRLRPSGSKQSIPKLSLESLQPNKVAQIVRPKLNILVLDSGIPQTKHSGKIVLVENTLCELSKYYNVHYVYFPEKGERFPSHSFLNAYTKSVDVLLFAYEESGWGRFLNWVFFKPWFYARWRYPGDWKKARNTLRDLSKKYSVDAMVSLTYQMAQFAFGLGLSVLDCHGDSKARIVNRQRQNKSSFIDKANLWLLEKKTYGYESWIIRRSDASIFLSEGDADLYRNAKSEKKIFVIPNGVDTAYFTPRLNSREAEVPTLLFTGHMSYQPNRDTALILCREILPRVQKEFPNTKVVIAGADPTDEIKSLHDGISIVVTGKVEDLRPYFEEAWVYACPMRLGAGIKNKLLEAMAMKKAIVATTCAAAGISVTSGEELILAGDWDGMAEATMELLRSSLKRRDFGNRARLRVERDYQWQAIGEKRSELLRMISRNGHHQEAVLK